MPASTESSHTKKSILNHVRKDLKPVDRQGALCLQVSETQFIEQFDVDVSCGRKSSPITTPPRREPLASLNNRELVQKPHEPHAAFWHCAKPRVETKVEVQQELSWWKGWWAPQFLRAGHDKCGKFPWSFRDNWKNCIPRPHTPLGQRRLCNSPGPKENTSKYRGFCTMPKSCMRLMRLLRKLSNTPTKSSPAMTPIIEDMEESEFDFGDNYQSGTNSWAWHLPEEDEEDLSLVETWSENSAQFTPNKLDVNGFPVGGSSPPAAAQDLDCNVKVEAKPDSTTLEAINLTPFEQWIIGRVREARQDGISAADAFCHLRNRCMEREQQELNLMAHELV
ncbi:hypothetical protein B0H14DRAFT_2597339 [Mycena olivaceomarginata]|nr:hypothetical protein B0H14DRAFT_2597339 [Mycena olivaceomarginata]